MGVNNPISNFAILLLNRYSLTPPINVEEIVKKYSELSFIEIPIDGVDGVTLNLKIKGKQSKVIVNSKNPTNRQRFTLAHELGHLIIPWHIGNIIDSLNAPEDLKPNSHWQVENEANIFAAEFLMPTKWIKGKIAKIPNLSDLHNIIAKCCEVSLQAAAIRLTPLLPPNIVYAVTKDDIVLYSGKTNSTFAMAPPWGEKLEKNLYPYATEHYQKSINKQMLHWWELPSTLSIKTTDVRPWRDILDEIIRELPEYSNKVASINGIISGVNGRKKNLGTGYTKEALASALIQRFNDDKVYINLIKHPKFESFIYQRINDFIY